MTKVINTLIMLTMLAIGMLLANAANASTYHITSDPGGVIVDFIAKYKAMKADGTNVEIDGPCMSACTLVVSILPRARICVMPGAIIGVHSATWHDGDREGFDKAWTQRLFRSYPADLRAAIEKRGWHGDTEHTAIIPIRGAELRRIIHPC